MRIGGEDPVVRPFFLTRGRTSADLPLEAVVVTREDAYPACAAGLEAEGVAIVRLCLTPRAVAEVAGRLGLPLGVARVLVSDLAREGLVEVTSEAPEIDEELLDRLIRGVERL